MAGPTTNDRRAIADKGRAKNYSTSFYNAHRTNMQAMLDAAQNGAIAFLSGMTEKDFLNG